MLLLLLLSGAVNACDNVHYHVFFLIYLLLLVYLVIYFFLIHLIIYCVVSVMYIMAIVTGIDMTETSTSNTIISNALIRYPSVTCITLPWTVHYLHATHSVVLFRSQLEMPVDRPGLAWSSRHWRSPHGIGSMWTYHLDPRGSSPG